MQGLGAMVWPLFIRRAVGTPREKGCREAGGMPTGFRTLEVLVTP